MLGILAEHHIPQLTPTSMLCLLAIASIATGLLLLLKKRPTIALLLLFLAGGSLLGRATDPTLSPRHWSRLCTAHPYMQIRIEETPYLQSKTYRCKARAMRCDQQPAHGTLRLYLRADSMAATLRYGDQLLIHAHPDTSRQSVYLTSDHYTLVAHTDHTPRALAERLRLALLHRLQQSPLAPDHQAIIAALTLGHRANISPDLRKQYRDAGIAHLLCVSGLHVGLLAALVGGLLFWVGKTRRGRILKGATQVLAVWLFALVTGLAPTTQRAALMFSLLIAARCLNRRTPSLNILAATAIITLTLHPMLLFDVGWQLSYAAVAGILCTKPLLGECRSTLLRSAIVSMAATLATLPITLHTFHQFPLFFLIANVVIVPAAGLILALGLLCIAFPCSVAIATPLGALLQAIDWLTAHIAALPHSTLHIDIHSTASLVAIALAAALILLSLKPIVAHFSSTTTPLPR